MLRIGDELEEDTAHIRNIDDACGLRPGLDVLELGCGVGRGAIPLIDILGLDGSYVGVDVMGPSIAWCRQSISASAAVPSAPRRARSRPR